MLRPFSRLAVALFLLAGLANTALAAGPPPPVPEINPGSMTSAVALLAGGLLLLTDRLRRR